jgi:hypothetical protein
MNLRFPLLIATGAVALLGAASAEQVTRSPKAQQELAKALAGRVAQEPVNCINDFRSEIRMTVIDDYTLLFRSPGGVVYVQNPPGGCANISNKTNALTTRRTSTNQLCAGDINQVVQPSSGIFRGSCAFGRFVPYRKAS